MYSIKLNDDEEYINIIKDMLINFESYTYIFKNIDIILKSIEDDIRYIIYDDSDNIYNKIIIKLNGAYYGINYDNKNYPLISFYCDEIIIHDVDTIINFNDVIINMVEINLKNFKKL